MILILLLILGGNDVGRKDQEQDQELAIGRVRPTGGHEQELKIAFGVAGM
jgi:hypothetical protein